MDSLAENHAVIVRDEKTVCIPYGDEVLIVQCNKNKNNEDKMILKSVEQGPLLWPSVEVEGVTRLKKYSELSAAEAIQADCDVKATNIILQGLSPKVYALVSTYKVAKELWERI
nr:hypothetical protein [Tanacetum cinerariifolium]